jgi:hypothetical protein
MGERPETARIKNMTKAATSFLVSVLVGKRAAANVWNIGIWDFEFVWDLMLGISTVRGALARHLSVCLDPCAPRHPRVVFAHG